MFNYHPKKKIKLGFSFTPIKTKNLARTGIMTTAHGQILTPVFMPVGTKASIKSLSSQDLLQLQAQIILANTYHLYLKPGLLVLNQSQGIHRFMNWSKPVLTDSGGFQVFSLNRRQQRQEKSTVKIFSDGVVFKSHLDGSSHIFTAEKAIEIQRQIGADIIMTFDECTPENMTAEYRSEALDRTHRWAKRSFDYWQSQKRLSTYGNYQALFGISQGGEDLDLRRKSVQYLTQFDFDGLAYGGETVGYNMNLTTQLILATYDLLPENKPRYGMGVGRDPADVVAAIMSGYDMFDCVAPSRIARNGVLYHGQLIDQKQQCFFQSQFPKGRLSIGNQEFATQDQVIQDDCDCQTCLAGYTRSYLHHLYKAKELSYFRLATIHNWRFMTRLVEQLRDFINR